MTKGSKILFTLLTVLIVCAVALSAFVAYGQIRMQNTLKETKDELTESLQSLQVNGRDPGTEDDVVIMEEYTIRSTTQISDAYLNGDTSALSDRDKETLDMAKKVLKKIIKKGMTDYEKEEAVYLWLTTKLHADTGLLTVIPTTADGVDNPYGVLKNHDAVCVGYATTMRLFMQMLGIECKVIHSSDLVHSWDLVHLDDGWYHVDCYSDADGVPYANFNMDDTLARVNHTWNAEFFPAANGMKYTYAAQHSEEIKNIYAIPAWVKKLLESEKSIGCCTFKEKIQPDEENIALAMVTGIQNRLSDVSDYSVEGTWSKNAAGDYVLTFSIYRYNDDTPQLDEKTQEKVDAAIEDALGELIASSWSEDDFMVEESTEPIDTQEDGVYVDTELYEAIMNHLTDEDWDAIEQGLQGATNEEATTAVAEG